MYLTPRQVGPAPLSIRSGAAAGRAPSS